MSRIFTFVEINRKYGAARKIFDLCFNYIFGQGEDSLFSRRYNPEFETTIPHKAEYQLKAESLPHKINEYWRLFRREISLIFNGQKFLERKVIPAGTKKILWLAPSLQNIGDSVMSLSGRILLKGQYQIDLLVNEKNLPLFAADDVFNQVYTDPKQVNESYDLILLYCVKSITLKMKKKYFSKVPYCHFRSHFDGIEFNWILYSFHRINALLDYPYNQEQIDKLARPRLTIPDLVNYDSARLIVAIGGEDVNRRTYVHWSIVIADILEMDKNITICLLGNDNAQDMAAKLLTQFDARVTSEVGKHNLLSAASLIKNSAYFIGCDGGLMHIASAFELPGVTLFGFFEPEYRLPYNSKLTALFNETSVNLINPQEVVSAFLRNRTGEIICNNCRSV